MWKIAKILEIAIGTVYNYLHLYEIPTRANKDTFTRKGSALTDEQKKQISLRQRGKLITEETKRKMSEAKKIHSIGHKKLRQDGYISVYYPDHPYATKDGYIMEHRLIMEQHIGRYLKEDEVVHHKNKNRLDNNIDNLELMTFIEHARLHLKERYRNKEE